MSFCPSRISPTSRHRQHPTREPCCRLAHPQTLCTVPCTLNPQPAHYPGGRCRVRQNPGDECARTLWLRDGGTGLPMPLKLLRSARSPLHRRSGCFQRSASSVSPSRDTGAPSAHSACVATVLWSLLPAALGLSEPGSSPTPPRRLMCTLTRGRGVRVREARSRPHRRSSRGRGAGAAAAAGGPGGTRLLRAAPWRASLDWPSGHQQACEDPGSLCH